MCINVLYGYAQRLKSEDKYSSHTSVKREGKVEGEGEGRERLILSAYTI